MARVSTDHFEHGKYHIQHTEDVEPLLDYLKELRNNQDQQAYKASPARWRKIGEIPTIIIEKWLLEGFNALAPGAGPEVIKRLERDYPYLLAVDKI